MTTEPNPLRQAVVTETLKVAYDRLHEHYMERSGSASTDFRYGMLEALGLLLDLRHETLEDK